jgi:hypothetical protein
MLNSCPDFSISKGQTCGKRNPGQREKTGCGNRPPETEPIERTVSSENHSGMLSMKML